MRHAYTKDQGIGEPAMSLFVEISLIKIGVSARPLGLSVVRLGQLNRAFELLKTKLAKDGRGKFDGVG